MVCQRRSRKSRDTSKLTQHETGSHCYSTKTGGAVDLELMLPLENDERVEVLCYFTHDRLRWDGSWPGVEPNWFLEHYTPFTFIVSINGGEKSKSQFSTERW